MPEGYDLPIKSGLTAPPVARPKPASPAPVARPTNVGATINPPVSPIKAPTEAPQPALSNIGFPGGINEFNTRVQTAHSAFVQTHGYEPTPGLVLDIARSSVPTETMLPLLTPVSAADNRAKAALNQHMQENPHEWLVTRPDGITQANTPFLNLLSKSAGSTNPMAPAVPLSKMAFPALLKKYPMVSMGMLPIPLENALYGAVGYLNHRGPNAVADGSDMAQAAKNAPPFDQYKLRGGSLFEDVGAVTTVKQAQVELNKAMNTELPVTGVMNQTWISAIGNWQKTSDYVVKQLKHQASAAGFGSNVEAYAKAWHQKQRAASHGLVGHFVSAMPLPLFGHGGFWDDIVSIPGYIKGSSANPIDIGLHSLTRSSGLTLDTVGGTVSQAKADLAAGTTLARELGLPNKYGGKTYTQALTDAREQLRANPSWMRLAAAGYLPAHETGTLAALDQLTNFVGDIILLRKPMFTGEKLAAGDYAGALKSPYIRSTAKFAHADLANGNVARAAAMLEGGPGAEKLATAAGPLVQDGTLTPELLRQHAADLWAHGHTTLPDGTAVDGPLLGSLHSAKLPTPGKPGVAWITTKRGLRDAMDSFDGRLRDANVTADSHARDFTRHLGNTLRSAFGHAAPRSGRGLFDPGLPEGVRNFVLKNFKDPKLAEQYANDVVRLRAKEDVPGLQELDQSLRDLYNERFPVRAGGGTAPQTPFEARLDTEAPTVFHFPGGGKREITGDAIDRMVAKWQNRAATVDQKLNTVGRAHSLAILSTGMSLAYKHMTDTLRRALAEDGPIFGDTLNAAERADLNTALANPKTNRAVGSYLERSRDGETRWMLRRSGRNVNSVDFTTGEQMGSKSYMTAAGGYLRRRLDSQALNGYLQSHDTPDALAQVILKSDFFKGRFYSEMGDEVKAAKQTRDAAQMTLGDLAGGLTREQEYGRNLYGLARDYSPKIAHEFKEFEDAAKAAGVEDPWSEVAGVYAKNQGAHADAAIGKWIADNKIDFPVRGGLVNKTGLFDDALTRWVGTLMTANKWNRGQLAEREFERKFADLRGAGFDHETAAAVAMDVGERLVKYHMLDFSNRLQIEQDLRWLSYFATKHRLYWKWVGATMLRRPGVAAIVDDIRKNLNGNGSVDFTLFGMPLTLPVARLTWVPGKEYSEFSPLAIAGAGFVKGTAQTGNVGTGVQQALDSVGGTYGNIFTRQDTTLNLAARLVAVYSGAAPATYGLLTAGLPKAEKDQVNFIADTYQARYMHLHNGTPAPEAEVVKYALLHATARTAWQAGMPLPVIPQSPQNPAQKEIKSFLALNDPRQRRNYLEKHPDVASYFGVWTNPADYTYARGFWSRVNQMSAQLESERASILQRSKESGWTPALETEYRAASKQFGIGYDQLLLEDARRTGTVVNGEVRTPGKWGKTVNTDPFLTSRMDVHKLFPNIGAKELATNVPGPLVKDLRTELALIQRIIDNKGSAQYAPLATDMETLKTRRRDILTQLDAFKAYPTDAASKVHAAYQDKFVSPYWKWEEKSYLAIQALPSGQQQDVAWAKFQADRDARDKSVTVDGVKFPSPVRMAWAQLDPQTRQQRLAKLATGDWSHLTDYEKTLLGAAPASPGDYTLSDAWGWLADATAAYHKANPGVSLTRPQIVATVKQIDKQRPGFFKDWLFAQQPKAVRFKFTPLYTDAPAAVKTELATIVQDAVTLTKAKQANGSSSYYDANWRNFVQDQLTPWINEPGQAALRAYIAQFGPDFLNTLTN